MLRLSLPRLNERGRGAPVVCADLIRAVPALVPTIKSLAARGSFFCEASFRPRRRCLPRRLIAQTALSLGKNVRSAHTENLSNGKDMIYTDGPFSGKYARNLRLRHAATACDLSSTEAPAISKFTQNARHQLNITSRRSHAVSMPSGNTHAQLELTSVANWHRLCGMGYIPIGIADVIEASADARGISLLQLSKKSGISYSGVLRKVKHRTRRINVDDLCAFAAALEVQPSELVKQAESRANAEPQKPTGYAIQDKASGSIILQARRVDWDGGEEE